MYTKDDLDEGIDVGDSPMFRLAHKCLEEYPQIMFFELIKC